MSHYVHVQRHVLLCYVYEQYVCPYSTLAKLEIKKEKKHTYHHPHPKQQLQDFKQIDKQSINYWTSECSALRTCHMDIPVCIYVCMYVCMYCMYVCTV